MEYIIYKIIDGKRYKYGIYSDPINLAYAAHTLGSDGFEITIEIYEKREKQ